MASTLEAPSCPLLLTVRYLPLVAFKHTIGPIHSIENWQFASFPSTELLRRVSPQFQYFPLFDRINHLTLPLISLRSAASNWKISSSVISAWLARTSSLPIRTETYLRLYAMRVICGLVSSKVNSSSFPMVSFLDMRVAWAPTAVR